MTAGGAAGHAHVEGDGARADDPEAVGLAALVEDALVGVERHLTSERHELIAMLIGQGAEDAGPCNHDAFSFLRDREVEAGSSEFTDASHNAGAVWTAEAWVTSGGTTLRICSGASAANRSAHPEFVGPVPPGHPRRRRVGVLVLDTQVERADPAIRMHAAEAKTTSAMPSGNPAL
jgi:hypothetical protein